MSEKTQHSESGESVAGTEPARSPYFTPRRLGATAPHDCSIWRLDFREGRPHSASSRLEAGERIRRFDDDGFMPELELLLDAGLRVTRQR